MGLELLCQASLSEARFLLPAALLRLESSERANTVAHSLIDCCRADQIWLTQMEGSLSASWWFFYTTDSLLSFIWWWVWTCSLSIVGVAGNREILAMSSVTTFVFYLLFRKDPRTYAKTEHEALQYNSGHVCFCTNETPKGTISARTALATKKCVQSLTNVSGSVTSRSYRFDWLTQGWKTRTPAMLAPNFIGINSLFGPGNVWRLKNRTHTKRKEWTLWRNLEHGTWLQKSWQTVSLYVSCGILVRLREKMLVRQLWVQLFGQLRVTKTWNRMTKAKGQELASQHRKWKCCILLRLSCCFLDHWFRMEHWTLTDPKPGRRTTFTRRSDLMQSPHHFESVWRTALLLKKQDFGVSCCGRGYACSPCVVGKCAKQHTSLSPPVLGTPDTRLWMALHFTFRFEHTVTRVSGSAQEWGKHGVRFVSVETQSASTLNQPINLRRQGIFSIRTYIFVTAFHMTTSQRNKTSAAEASFVVLTAEILEHTTERCFIPFKFLIFLDNCVSSAWNQPTERFQTFKGKVPSR